MPRPSTGPKLFWAGPKRFLDQTENSYSSLKLFQPRQKMISIKQIRIFYRKVFEEALNAIKFLDWLKNLNQLKTFWDL